MGQGARLNETLEPITGLEDQDQAYGHHGRQPVQGDPEAVRAHRHGDFLEPITGLEDQKGAYATPDRQQHQPEPVIPQLHSNLRSYPKDDNPKLPTSDSFHRLADAAEAVRQPEGRSKQTHSNDAAGKRQQAEAGHAAGRSYLNHADMQDRDPLTTIQSDIMDSHAALFSSNVPSSSHMYDMLHKPEIAAGNDRTGPEQEQEQRSLHLQERKVRHLGLASHAATTSMHDSTPQQQYDLPPGHLQHQEPSAQQQQQSREARKLDDPGHADGDRRAQPGCESRPEKGSDCRIPIAISCEAFWNIVALMLAAAITALFIVLTIVDASERHEGPAPPLPQIACLLSLAHLINCFGMVCFKLFPSCIVMLACCGCLPGSNLRRSDCAVLHCI